MLRFHIGAVRSRGDAASDPVRSSQQSRGRAALRGACAPQGATHFAGLGDCVGYGADPPPTLDQLCTLLGYARRHLVHHIIVGARGSSALRRHLGSVSAAVAAKAPCTVIVVRTRKDIARR